jgi:hypothetical protein
MKSAWSAAREFAQHGVRNNYGWNTEPEGCPKTPDCCDHGEHERLVARRKTNVVLEV